MVELYTPLKSPYTSYFRNFDFFGAATFLVPTPPTVGVSAGGLAGCLLGGHGPHRRPLDLAAVAGPATGAVPTPGEAEENSWGGASRPQVGGFKESNIRNQ